jgi:hypothetical protein
VPKLHTCSGLDSHNEQKTLAFKVPLQTELRFPLRRYEQPHSMGDGLRRPPYGAGAGSHMSCKPAQSRRSQAVAAVRTTAQRLQVTLHFCPDQRAKGAGSHAGSMQPRQVDALLRLPTRPAWRPGPRVTQPARRMLHASNCTATCATTAPPRLQNQYRDSRRPSARPSNASLAWRSMRPKWAGSNDGGKRAGAAVTSSAKLTSHPGQQENPLSRHEDNAPVIRSSNGSRNGRPANHSHRRINSAAGQAAPLAGEAGDASPSP